MRILSLISITSIALALLNCSQPQEAHTPMIPEAVTYHDHIKTILDRCCVRCHGGQVTHGINLSSYGQIMESVGNDPSEDLIVVGNPQSKILRLRLNPETGNMYLYLNDPLEYDLIYQWIVSDGLQE